MFVQLTAILEDDTTVDVILVGFLQVGYGWHTILEVQPGKLKEVSETNLKVKHPEVLVASKGPGIVVPQNAPGNSTVPFPGPLPLEICGAAVEFPS